MSIFKDLIVYKMKSVTMVTNVLQFGCHVKLQKRLFLHSDQILLDYIFALTKGIDNIIKCALYCYLTHFSL